MDFTLDPIVAATTIKSANNSSDTLVPDKSTVTPTPSNDDINKKTEEEFQKLEDKVEETFNLVQKATMGWGSSLTGFLSKVNVEETSKKLTENLKMDQLLERGKQVGQQVSKQVTESISHLTEQDATEDTQAKEVDSKETGDTKDKKMLDLLSTATNNYLDDLDHELEQVEKYAGMYATKLSSFVKKNIIEGQAMKSLKELRIDEANKGDLDDSETQMLFNVPEVGKTAIYASRTEAQIHALHTSQDLYLTEAHDSAYITFSESFDIDSKTDDITSRLKKYPQLHNLMSLLVPTKIAYNEFWQRYYFMYEQILQQEERRKKLLEQDQQEEDFKWDDEDEDDDAGKSGTGVNNLSVKKPGESRSSSELTYDLKSANSSTLDVVASKKGKTDDDDDDDDDWE